MINALILFEDCLQHTEPLIDEFYCNEQLIISEDPSRPPTNIMATNRAILDRITACKIALIDGDTPAFERHIEQLTALLENKLINFTEFTSFWPALDVSVSTYRKLPKSQQKVFLETVVKLYLEKRHNIYAAHGYTATTIQVRKDFEKHKTGGNAGNIKVAALLANAGYAQYAAGKFSDQAQVFAFLDNAGFSTLVLDELVSVYRLKFDWRRKHQNKSADLVFNSTEKQVFICEFKHMKEGGGGQDKQIAELISLIEQREASQKISYVAFLDGIYFNTFATSTTPKAREQVLQIRAALKKNPANYFVNTYGLTKLLGG